MRSFSLQTLPFMIIGPGAAVFFPEVARQRVSSSILISTTTVIVAVSLVIGWVNQLY